MKRSIIECAEQACDELQVRSDRRAHDEEDASHGKPVDRGELERGIEMTDRN